MATQNADVNVIPEAETCVFFEEQLQMDLPKEWKLMEGQPGQNLSSPAIMKVSEAKDCGVTLSIADAAVTEETFNEVLMAQRQVLWRVVGGYREYGMPSKKINGQTVGCIVYESNGVNNTLYNVFFITAFKEKMLVGTFFCDARDIEKWNDYFPDYLESLKIL